MKERSQENSRTILSADVAEQVVALNQLNRLPLDEILLARLAAATGATSDEIRIIERVPNIQATTFPTEVVTCELRGHCVRWFCKHFHPEIGHSHRAPIRPFYEIEVYRDFLRFTQRYYSERE